MRTHTARTRREYRRSGNPPTPQANTRKGKEYKHSELLCKNVNIRPIVIIKSEALLFPPFWSEATYNKYLSVEILIFETRNGKNKEGWRLKSSPQLSERDKNYSCIKSCITTFAE